MKYNNKYNINDNYTIAGQSSLVARRAHNPEAVGSNPAPATKENLLFFMWRSSSVG